MLQQIEREAEKAQAKYGPFTSTHEAYGVLAEELAELLDAIRANDMDGVRKEAMQASAVAYRLAVQAADMQEAFMCRSGCRP